MIFENSKQLNPEEKKDLIENIKNKYYSKKFKDQNNKKEL